MAQGAVYVQFIWGEAIACGKGRQKGNTYQMQQTREGHGQRSTVCFTASTYPISVDDLE